VRISPDAAGVILSGAFPREDLIFYILILEKIKKGEILTSQNSLLRMTGRVDEIATSHRTLLAMTD